MFDLRSLKGKKIFVGLSGGVDSAVSAALLKDAGADVTGIFMKNWAGEQGLQLDCPWEEDQRSAQEVAQHLDIEFASYNFEKEYKESVLDYFFSEYESGRTPNPDILCNSEIKFKAFLDKAKSEGAEYIATGHYAGKSISENKSYSGEILLRPKDRKKDQTYFLSGLNQSQLNAAIFPLENLEKSEVRELAHKYQLPNADRKDSQGICFIGDLDVQSFLRKYIKQEPGDIIDQATGRKVGEHDGMAYFTIGQREGIGIGGVKEPYFVSKKDSEKNIVYVVMGRNNPALYSDTVNFENISYINESLKEFSSEELNSLGVSASIRYRHEPEKGSIDLKSNRFIFDKPQRAISPGQSIVFYSGDICLGRAVIIS